jgi:hypothetical protein
VNASFETGGDQLRPVKREAGRNRSSAFSWSMTINLPTLKQTCLRSASRGLSGQWMDANHEDQYIRSRSD